MQKPLFLHEELMLLTLRDKEGTVAAGKPYQYVIAASLVAELLLMERVTVEETKKKLVDLVSNKPTGDPILDECLGKLQKAKRRASLKAWVSRFANLKRLKHRVAGQLVRRSILRADEDKVLLIFTRKIYPELNPKPERELVSKLRKAIFTDTRNVDPRTAVLISLAHNGDILKNVFEKRDLKRRKARIKQIIAGEMTGKAAKEAIEAMQAAVMVAVIMPATGS